MKHSAADQRRRPGRAAARRRRWPAGWRPVRATGWRPRCRPRTRSASSQPRSLDAQLAEQRDVRGRPAEADAADPAPLPGDGAQRDRGRRAGGGVLSHAVNIRPAGYAGCGQGEPVHRGQHGGRVGQVTEHHIRAGRAQLTDRRPAAGDGQAAGPAGPGRLDVPGRVSDVHGGVARRTGRRTSRPPGSAVISSSAPFGYTCDPYPPISVSRNRSRPNARSLTTGVGPDGAGQRRTARRPCRGPPRRPPRPAPGSSRPCR